MPWGNSPSVAWAYWQRTMGANSAVFQREWSLRKHGHRDPSAFRDTKGCGRRVLAQLLLLAGWRGRATSTASLWWQSCHSAKSRTGQGQAGHALVLQDRTAVQIKPCKDCATRCVTLIANAYIVDLFKYGQKLILKNHKKVSFKDQKSPNHRTIFWNLVIHLDWGAGGKSKTYYFRCLLSTHCCLVCKGSLKTNLNGFRFFHISVDVGDINLTCKLQPAKLIC